MSRLRSPNSAGHIPTILSLCVGLAAVPLATPAGWAAEDRDGVVARSPSGKHLILLRPAGKKEWQVVAGKGSYHPGDLLVGVPGSAVESTDRAVRLVFRADLDQQSPYPIREAAVLLHANPKADLDLTLDRGRVDLVNTRKKGAAHVHLRVQKVTWDLTLATPGTSLALELYGRWPAGVPFTPKPGPKDVPNLDLIFLVLKGEVILKHQQIEHILSAPPGPALIEWDNFTGLDETPRRLEDLPKWSRGGGRNTARGQALQRFGKALQKHSLDEVMDRMLESDSEADRRLALIVMAATDDLARLAKALRESRHPDVREYGILALRHWIGRGPGQDQIVYQVLTQKRKLPPVQAETIVQLLHSFGDNDLAQPETYQTLIDYLEHDLLPIRGLAYWHLERLVPDGMKLGYDPHDSKDKREAAVARWRKLVPKGKVPPRPKPEEEKKEPTKQRR